MYCNILRRLGYGLSRELWLVEIGIFFNYLGYGAVLPFEIIYLHDGRGFSLGVAGAVIGVVTGAAVAAAPVAGPLIDRFGARTVAAWAGLALAGGYAGLAFAQSELAAFAAAAVGGIGNGLLNPSQSTLVAALAPSEIRHRATAVSRVAANAGMGIGGAFGGFFAHYGLRGFVALFLANALTYMVYVAVLLAVVRADPRFARLSGGYRLVLRDRAFVRLAFVNVAMIGVGWGVFTWLLPPFAKNELGIGPEAIGLLLFANAVTVVVAQVPIARLAEGHRRVVLIALAGAIFAGACGLVLATEIAPVAGYAVMMAATVGVAIGECLHTTALMPLVAELAPPELRGRYMAAIGLSWWIGLAAAPTIGGQLLSVSPTATFVAAIGVAAAAAVFALALEPRLPAQARLTPRPASR